MTSNKTLQKKIMRRVYTAYAMRMLLGTRARHLAVMALCAYGLVQYVSILDVAYNFSTVTVGDVGRFVLGALEQTESVTLIILAVFGYALYAFWRGDTTSRSHFGHV